MSSSSNALTIKQQRVVAELLSGSSITQTAKAVGLSRETIYQYLKKPAVQAVFLQKLDTLSTVLYGQSLGLLSEAIGDLQFGTLQKKLKRIKKTFDLICDLKELRSIQESKKIRKRL